MKHFFLYINILFLSFSCFAQEDEPFYFQFTVEDGLPSNRIYDFIQDSKGYLWIATDNGLVRFNGREFKEFTTEESVNPEYSYLYELKDGSIWCINFGNQVFKVSGDSLKVIKQFNPYFNDRKYFRLLQWQDSILYLGTKERIVAYDPFEDTMTEIKLKAESEREINNLAIDSTHLFYSATVLEEKKYNRRDYLLKIGNNKKNRIQLPSSQKNRVKTFSSSKHIYAIKFPLSNPNNGIIHTIYNHELKDTLFVSKKFKSVASISHIKPDETWINTTGGAIDLKRKKTFFKEKNITKVRKDYEDNYWMSSYDSGLFLIPNINATISKKIKNPILKIEIINDSLLALGSSDGNIHIFDINKDTIINSIFVSKYNSDKFLLMNKNKTLYLPQVSSIKDINYQPFSKLVRKDAYLKKYCPIDDDKNSILILSGFNRVYLVQENNATRELSSSWKDVSNDVPYDTNYSFQFDKKTSKKTGNIENIHAEKNKDRIWIIANHKTYIEEQKELKEFKYSNGNSLKINYISSYNNKLVAAKRKYGLVFIQGDSISHERQDSTYKEFGSISKIIHADDLIVSLAKKGIIISDNKGNIIHTLDETDGLKGSTINDIIYLNKELWIASSKGLFNFSIDKIKDNTSLPIVYINQLLINNLAENIHTNNHVFSNNIDIEILFDGIAYKGRKNSLYKYRLNKNEEWRTLSYNANSIRFPNLSAGKYLFQIKIVNEEGIEGKISSFNFKVLSPIWLRWWFILGTLAIIGSILYYSYLLKLKRVEQENKWQQEIRANKLSALQSRMNPHFIFNSLNSIQDFIVKLDKMGANEYLGIFSDLMRTYLSQSEKEEIELHEEIEALKLYLKLEKLRFGDINIHFHVDRMLKDMDIFIPPLFIQPYVENVFKHGLLHKTEKDKKISIDFKFIPNENQLKIIIEDNGVGREKVLKIQGKSSSLKGLSYSTKANETRLELLNHNRTGKIQVNTIDLSEDNIPTGTKIVIIIPLQ